MVLKLTKEDLIKAMNQPKTAAEAAGAIQSVAGIGAALEDGTEGWLGRIEGWMGKAVKIIEHVEKIRTNPLVMDAAAKYMQGKIPEGMAGVQSAATGQPPHAQGQPLPPSGAAVNPELKKGEDGKVNEKQQTDLIIESLEATKAALGDLKISKMLEMISRNRGVLELAIKKKNAEIGRK